MEFDLKGGKPPSETEALLASSLLLLSPSMAPARSASTASKPCASPAPPAASAASAAGEGMATTPATIEAAAVTAPSEAEIKQELRELLKQYFTATRAKEGGDGGGVAEKKEGSKNEPTTGHDLSPPALA